MEFLIFSDSHGAYDSAREAFRRQIRTPDAVFFLGDGLREMRNADFEGASFFAVRGNCDFFACDDAPEELVLSFEGHKLLLCHGHCHRVKSGYAALISHAAKLGADLVLFGHTHMPHAEMLAAGTLVGGIPLCRPMYLFNPGSLREGSFGTLSLKGEGLLFSHGRL